VTKLLPALEMYIVVEVWLLKYQQQKHLQHSMKILVTSQVNCKSSKKQQQQITKTTFNMTRMVFLILQTEIERCFITTRLL